MRPVIGPLNRMLYSRKVLIVISDAVFSITATLLTYYLAPDHLVVALAVVAALQPVVVALIAAIAKEDAAEKANN